MKIPGPTPPKYARKILISFLRDDLAEEVQGDLEEKFLVTTKNKSRLRAQLNYWYQVVHYLRPFAIRKTKNIYINDYAMFQSYFKIGWRNMRRNVGYTSINVGGLAVGMAVAILNGLWLWDELSFNKYYENYDRIAQVGIRGENEDGIWRGVTVTYPMGTVLIEKYHDQFKRIVRTSFGDGGYEGILSSGDKKISAGGLSADTEAPEMFTFKMIHGTRDGLKETHSIMIAASVSKALFGDDDPINKIITINNSANVTVTGVYEDFPLNTKFHKVKYFTTWGFFLLTNPWIEKSGLNNWREHSFHIYVEILPGSNFEDVAERIRNIIQVAPEDVEKGTRHALLFPMNEWHLFPFESGRGAGTDKGPMQMVWMVGSIGMFVLLLACVNFMNLSTARSEKRAKEVGIRKTIGSLRRHLIHQFFSESYIVVLSAFVFSILLVALALPWFNDLSAKRMVIPWSTPAFWMISIAFLFITGLLAGSYPAFFLSSFQPVKVLKGTFRAGRLASIPRKVLVVMQFTVSVALIICTIIVYQQIQFAKNRPVGYTREGLITLAMKSGEFYKQYSVLRNELKNSGVVDEVSASMGRITELGSNNGGFGWAGQEPDQDQNFGTLAVTAEHGKTIGWQFIKGRDFSGEHASDSMGMVINETAAKFIGIENPIGESVTWEFWTGNRRPLHYKIIGVIKDAVMGSPYEPIKPTVFYLKGHNGGVSWINIRIKNGVTTSDALAKIDAVFKKVIPSAPFDYKFVDEEYALKFAAEERIGKLASFFGTLAIFISCLGLFGLSSFVAEQRTKEIGIRKVLGATVTNLWRMLSRDFVVLVVLSCFIAIPVAYYFLDGWLQKYSYRIDISWWVFVIAGFGAVTITLATVSFQAIRAALANPVNSLKEQ
ncbi:MAG TPA: FtsX-like permease family protein [Chryseolinea sp.]|nr:FtsX-like permease family protein [Chryseolinea sp.]